jgi:hypothetical protein
MRSILAAAAATLLAACQTEINDVEGALQAYSQNRVPEAEAALTRIAAEPNTRPDERARAHRELARIHWLIDGDRDRALSDLRAARAGGRGACDAAILEARVLHEAGRAENLIAEAPALVRQCEESSEADRVRLEAAEAALDLASAGQPAALAEAQSLLGALGGDARAGLQGSAAALQLALLARDPAAALQAWRDYFWLTDTDLPQGLRHAFRSGADLFSGGLAAEATPEARLHLVDLLVRAGFADEAERFARSIGLPGGAAAHPLWRKASTYFRVRRELRQAILASNRRVARGGSADDLEAAVARAQAALMNAAGLSGDPRAGLRRAYGLYGTVGDTGGFASVHLGHIVQAEQRNVEQYGHRADVGFIAVDNMLANGYESWLWDGAAAAGGWTEEGPVIVQVRPEYTSGPLGAWALVNDPAARRRLVDRQAERKRADIAASRNGAIVFMAGLADRLRLQAAEQVAARARAIAGAGGDLRRTFLDEYWRANFQQSILAHEGRHALDRVLVRGLARFDDANLEYRAKLSQLALADYPRLALLNINDSTVGGDTPHGEANSQVLGEYAEWVAAHAAEVSGFDRRLPAAVQLDRLSDAQIRAIARSLDPIARR